MAFFGLLAAFLFGLFDMHWSTALIATVVAIIGTARLDHIRTQKALWGGNPLLLIWAAVPCLFLWWLGSLF